MARGTRPRPARPSRAAPRRRPGRIGHRWEAPVQVAAAHADRAVHEVAEVVGEVRVVAADEGLGRDVGVAVERHLAQDHVADAVDPERLGGLVGVADVAARLAHLLAAVEHEAVGEDLRGSGRPALMSMAGQ